MKVSLIQMNSVQDKQKNLQNARSLATQAIEQDGSKLVVFPEHFDWAGGSPQDKIAAGEAERDGPAYNMCRRLAQDSQIHVHSGSFYESTPDGTRVYNTSVVFNPQGDEIARYRKIHLFDIYTPDGMRYGESDAVAPGNGTVVVEIDGLKFGLAICYDIRFPELFQQLTSDGANVIVLPAAFAMQTGKDHWDVLCRARAIETQCYFLAAGQTGSFEQEGEIRSSYGHSLVCDPWGHIIAKASDGEGFISARLDIDRINQIRSQIPLAQHKVL
ncbi:carbon-nitrogen hydrolase family protein [Advenella alkanexedens]|uniref:carbon-nitrogen hydrolase family protein n=1 Tax=Advenella alkanexedens TaxID=1481665 RepID=UPI0026775727|nr:carbon-nitrogen hydrolase family protein [Advenella alkanexedens]WKU19711.1 carbon-nitrogen hydrolase family protein [Advenella alkanexedens]